MSSRQPINYSKDQHEQILLSLNAEELRRTYQEKLNHMISNSNSPPPEMPDSGFVDSPQARNRAKENWAKTSPRLIKSLTAPQVQA